VKNMHEAAAALAPVHRNAQAASIAKSSAVVVVIDGRSPSRENARLHNKDHEEAKMWNENEMKKRGNTIYIDRAHWLRLLSPSLSYGLDVVDKERRV